MAGLEVFVWLLALVGWVVFHIIQRVRKPPRPLGTIEDDFTLEPEPEPAPQPVRERPAVLREAPLDLEWGRAPVPTAAPEVQRRWVEAPPRSADRTREERALARQKQHLAEARRQQAQAARRHHPLRPQLRTARELRQGMVLATVLGPCRALEPYEPPDRA